PLVGRSPPWQSRTGMARTASTVGQTTERNVWSPDWGTAVVVDPEALRRLEEDNRRLRGWQRRRAVAAAFLLGASALSASIAYRQYSFVSKLRLKSHECRQNATRPNMAPSRASLEP